jgi:rhomboid protease GluP
MRYEYQLWRFIMPMFLHANLTHLLSNVISQCMIGSMLEAAIGIRKFAVLYILCG